jgi:hypothetical protein
MRTAVALMMMLGAFVRCASGDNVAPADRLLMIERSSMKVAGGTATLIIAPLRRTNDIFGGTFEMKVVPYFFKNDKGTLAIEITAESFAKASKGLPVKITGTATTPDKHGVIVRKIEAVATPADDYHGALKLWFDIDDRKMIFNTRYRFVEP